MRPENVCVPADQARLGQLSGLNLVVHVVNLIRIDVWCGKRAPQSLPYTHSAVRGLGLAAGLDSAIWAFPVQWTFPGLVQQRALNNKRVFSYQSVALDVGMQLSF